MQSIQEGIKQKLARFGIKDKKHSKKKQYKKNPLIDYNAKNLVEIILLHKDTYSIFLILDITRAIFELSKEVTKFPVLHPELIASGLAWKAIKHIYFGLTEEVRVFSELHTILKSATLTLKSLISFVDEIKLKGAESFAFRNLTKETEKDILLNFQDASRRIFG